MTLDKTWFHAAAPRPGVRLRLVCFHYAGGAAQMFNTWQRRIAPEIEVCAVQLPGRWSRLKEAPLRSVPAMAKAVADVFEPLLDRPYAVFGHSLGAAVGFELIHALAERGSRLPVHFFASARHAPHLPSAVPSLHRLPEAQFIAVLRDRYAALPREILEDPEMLPIFLNVLRADLEAIETYRYVPRAALSVPITAMGGTRDPAVAQAQLEAWADLTTAGFAVRMFDGDHFYLRPKEDEVIAALQKTLEPELIACCG
ncbi:Oleoyl-(acyl-carrier-protein) hydrolase [Methylobacterium sp. 4-46]|uniref:thioesterase II family protein n=1 Tax=unclassified Methylobacterium TaxID=2615210 RepID=UPI000152D988|nr:MULTISPECIES: alpha/beta fold hydrolase [Methylobacterium]ACA14748.1 Oleoyl-(acyl-carrier-protein) hydrolase [Methylobacterium sp. 4-46]WFT80500.1 alpha/beta fold hydrolase [Methylobacterium nodulans]